MRAVVDGRATLNSYGQEAIIRVSMADLTCRQQCEHNKNKTTTYEAWAEVKQVFGAVSFPIIVDGYWSRGPRRGLRHPREPVGNRLAKDTAGWARAAGVSEFGKVVLRLPVVRCHCSVLAVANRLEMAISQTRLTRI